jgi:hypothetical protein
MQPTTLLSCKEVSRIFTNFHHGTIRKLAAKGQLPVAAWIEAEPLFARDARTIRSIISIVRFGHVRN